MTEIVQRIFDDWVQSEGSWFRTTKDTFECGKIHVQIGAFSFSLITVCTLFISIFKSLSVSTTFTSYLSSCTQLYRSLAFSFLAIFFPVLWLNVCNPICGVGGIIYHWRCELCISLSSIDQFEHTCAPATHSQKIHFIELVRWNDKHSACVHH